MVDSVGFEVDRIKLIVDTYEKVAELELDYFKINGPILASGMSEDDWGEVVNELNKEGRNVYTLDYDKDELRVDFYE